MACWRGTSRRRARGRGRRRSSARWTRRGGGQPGLPFSRRGIPCAGGCRADAEVRRRGRASGPSLRPSSAHRSPRWSGRCPGRGAGGLGAGSRRLGTSRSRRARRLTARRMSDAAGGGVRRRRGVAARRTRENILVEATRETYSPRARAPRGRGPGEEVAVVRAGATGSTWATTWRRSAREGRDGGRPSRWYLVAHGRRLLSRQSEGFIPTTGEHYDDSDRDLLLPMQRVKWLRGDGAADAGALPAPTAATSGGRVDARRGCQGAVRRRATHRGGARASCPRRPVPRAHGRLRRVGVASARWKMRHSERRCFGVLEYRRRRRTTTDANEPRVSSRPAEAPGPASSRTTTS